MDDNIANISVHGLSVILGHSGMHRSVEVPSPAASKGVSAIARSFSNLG